MIILSKKCNQSCNEYKKSAIYGFFSVK